MNERSTGHDSFYRAFEDRFRGSRELIRSRLAVYLPFIEPLKSVYGEPAAVDLGCGRGEWLELLAENGFDARGVDLDEGMLAACRERGLPATQGDAIACLQGLPDESQAIVSGFHIAEHLPFAQLQLLVREALRVLKPAGLLILETPNPENFSVSSLTFHLDPTHRNPLPPALLSFLPEHYGFARVKVLRLAEQPELRDSDTASLGQVLGGVSPDYAVIAQKAAAKKTERLFRSAFDKEFGLGSHALVERFDRQMLAQREKAAALEALFNADHAAWVRSLQADLLSKNEALAARDAELTRASEALAAGARELERSAAAHAQLESWAKSLQADLDAKNKAVAAREQELARLREALGARGAELMRAREALMACEADLRRTREALAAREGEVAGLKEAQAAREGEIAGLKEARAADEARARALAGEMEALRHRQNDLLEKQGAAEAHAATMAQRLSEMSHELHLLRKVAEKKGLKRHLKRFERSIRKRRDRLRERLKKIERSIRKRRDRLRERLKRAERALRRQRDRLFESKFGSWLKRAKDVGRARENLERIVLGEPREVQLAYRRLRAAGDGLKHLDLRNLSRQWSRRRPRLAYVSPLPPQKTGVADYSSELIPALAAHYDVEAIVAAPPENIASLEGCKSVRDIAWFASHAYSYDRIIYHIGNSTFHHDFFSLLEKFPGVVVLHDFYLGHLLAFLELQGGWNGYWTRALCHAHGYEAVRRRFLPDGVPEAVRDYPANLFVIEQAQGIIVHSEFSRSLARRFYGQAFPDDWIVIPHLRKLPDNVDRAAARAALGLEEADFLVCAFGFLGENKLNHRLLECWLGSRLKDRSNCHLVFVGEAPESEYCDKLRAAIEQSPAKTNIRITGFASPEVYRWHLAAADAAVQLRRHSRGESSGTVLDCMAHGVPLIANAHGSAAELPNDGVMKLADHFENDDLIRALETLESDPSRRRELGDRARRIIGEEFSPQRAAAQYRDAIERFAGAARPLFSLPALAKEARRLVRANAPAWMEKARLFAAQSPCRRPRQLLVDISAMAQEDLRTGIQRVARAQLMGLLEEPPNGFRVEPVWLDQANGRWRYRYARRYASSLLGIPGADLTDEPVSVSPGDIYYMPDHFSGGVIRAAAAGLYDDWRARGVRVSFLIHDVLPVLKPEFFPDDAGRSHADWLRAISAAADQLICISQDVADQTMRWLQTDDPKRFSYPEFSVLHHGANLEASAPTTGLPETATAVFELIASRPTFLMVGTIEPRKGYLQTLAAFDLLWREGIDANLVIAGAEGWKPVPEDQRRTIPQIVASLRSHPQLGQRLFWLEDASDEYLEQLYRRAICLIAASEGEGFGLPLIEAARHKAPILARDIGVFREVAGDHAAYFSGLDPADLASAIKNWLAMYAEGVHPRSDDMSWMSWKENVARLKEILRLESCGDFPQHAADCAGLSEPRLADASGRSVAPA